MQNQMQVFENKEFGKMEILTIESKPYFPAAECAKMLGYKDSTNAVKQHCKGVVKHHILTQGGKQQANFIPEGDLYRLIIRSKLPAAERFEAWVCDEVLPTIRKHGAYITDDTLQKIREDSDFTDELIEKLTTERAKKGALLDYVGKLAPKARYYDIILQCTNAVQVSIIAKDYGMTASAFNKLLHAFGVQYRIGSTWLLYKEHSDKGFTVSRTYQVNPYKSAIHTYWTQRGRYFIYKLLSWHGILPEAEKYAVM